MVKLKKSIIRIAYVLVIVVPIAVFVHFLIFPQETRSILIPYSNFKREGRLYFDATTSQATVDTLNLFIAQASIRVSKFWGQKTCDPKFIYCSKEDDFTKFSTSTEVPAVTHLKLGSYIVLNSSGVDLDIIAHEIGHAELYERIGFFKWTFGIPSWFKQGLAMQNDYRAYYSEDTLISRLNSYPNLPSIRSYTTDKQFYKGTREQVMLNYRRAKQEVKHWYSKEKLCKLIQDLNSGISFEEAFQQ